MKVLAGIVLYNPETDRLQENIDAIYQQVDTVLLIENGSSNTNYKKHLKRYDNLLWIDNHASKGIAYALNQICGYAYSHGYDWALTLDQDSVASFGMVEVYKGIAKEDIGIIGCKIEDRNYDDPQQHGYKGTFEVPWVITSAAFTNTIAWYKCGGFDNEMFIDFVDADICYSMKKVGFKTLTTFHTKLLQEIGVGTFIINHKLFGELTVNNHPAIRKFFWARNSLYLSKKYDFVSLSKVFKIIIKTLIEVLFYERQKIRKTYMIIKGILHSLTMKPKYQHIMPEFLKQEAVKL